MLELRDLLLFGLTVVTASCLSIGHAGFSGMGFSHGTIANRTPNFGKVIIGSAVSNDSAERQGEQPNGYWSVGQARFQLAAAKLKRLGPSVHCGNDTMTLRVPGPRMPHFLVDRGPGSPVPVSGIPASCPISVKRVRRDVSFSVPFRDCPVRQQSGSYILSLIIMGAPVQASCPARRPGRPGWPGNGRHGRPGLVDLDGPEMDSPDMDDPEGQHKEGPDMEGPDMEGPDMEGPDMEGPDMEGPDMEGPDMEGPDMEGPDMEGPDMEGPDMEGPEMEGTDMEGPEMEGTDMEGPEMEGTDMEGPEMEGTDMEGTGKPGRHGRGKPGRHGRGKPGRHGRGKPGRHGRGKPGRHGRGKPGRHGRGKPGRHGYGKPPHRSKSG